MRRRVATFSLLFAWVCAHGAIWDAVQVFAWGKMFAGYAETMTVAAALRETFDPAKPCDMCLGVASVKETAKKQLPAAVGQSSEKLLLALHTPASVVFGIFAQGWPAAFSAAAPCRTETVPLPPPRV